MTGCECIQCCTLRATHEASWLDGKKVTSWPARTPVAHKELPYGGLKIGATISRDKRCLPLSSVTVAVLDAVGVRGKVVL